MKTMTCKELGGACNVAFRAETFEEIAHLSQQHGKEMHQKGDPAHITAMQKMHILMQDKQKMQAWLEEKREIFDNR